MRRGWVTGAVVVAVVAVVLGAVAWLGTGTNARVGADRSLAYVGADGLYVARTDGSAATRIVRGPDGFAELHRPRWSHDGRLLAYQFGGALHVTRPDGTDDRDLLSAGPHWEWSPTDDLIAIFDFDEMPEVWVYDVHGRRQLRMAGMDFAWTPDGSLYVVRPVAASTHNPVPHDELVRVRPDDHDAISTVAANFPDASRRRRLLLAGTTTEGAPLVWLDNRGNGVYEVEPDGLPLYVVHDGGARPVTRTLVNRSWIRRQPHGRALAVVTSTGRFVVDPRDLAVCSPTPSCRTIEGGAQMLDPAWSPDGRRLAFVRNDAPSGSGANFVDWSWHYAPRRLWVTSPTAERQPREIGWAGTGVGAPTFVGGHQLVFTRADGSLMWADLQTRRLRRIATLGSRATRAYDLPPQFPDETSDASTSRVPWTDLFAVAPEPRS